MEASIPIKQWSISSPKHDPPSSAMHQIGITRTVEDKNDINRHRYTIKLSKTIDGIMIRIHETEDGTPLLENYYASFYRYKEHKHDIFSSAEREKC